LALTLAAALILAACSGGTKDEDSADSFEGAEEQEDEDLGDPVDGGEIVVGLEAETNSLLPGESAFAESGLNMAFAIYDPLMMRTPDGEVEPYLAESMEPNDDLSAWTLTLRDGIE